MQRSTFCPVIHSRSWCFLTHAESYAQSQNVKCTSSESLTTKNYVYDVYMTSHDVMSTRTWRKYATSYLPSVATHMPPTTDPTGQRTALDRPVRYNYHEVPVHATYCTTHPSVLCLSYVRTWPDRRVEEKAWKGKAGRPQQLPVGIPCDSRLFRHPYLLQPPFKQYAIFKSADP